MKVKSKINSQIDLDYLINQPEGQYFDRKSAKIKPSDLAKHFSAFSNAEGGVLVLGISDSGELEGINSYGEEKINEFLNSPMTNTKPLMDYKPEFIDITNNRGDNDRILLYHIFPRYDQLIRTSNDSTYLRIGDKSREIKGEKLRDLEYSHSTRFFEDEINRDATINDLDKDLLKQYKERINAQDLTDKEVLKARGFMKNFEGKEYLTNAAVLLFAKYITQFYPNCRIRVLRYDGVKAEVGSNLNLINDYNIEEPILKIIQKTIDYISPQLKEFTLLDNNKVQFYKVPEYPRFAWIEGIVNAVAHREYSLAGNFIKVSIFDDRLEIENPGKLPNVVNINNIRETRYSRNPKIARVLTEFEWVRELNEGVKRIYSEMESNYLDEPIYIEPNTSVRLTLKNNNEIRKSRQNINFDELIQKEEWSHLNKTEIKILSFLYNKGASKRSQIENFINKSKTTVNRKLNHLLDENLIIAIGDQNSPNRTYDINLINYHHS